MPVTGLSPFLPGLTRRLYIRCHVLKQQSCTMAVTCLNTVMHHGSYGSQSLPLCCYQMVVQSCTMAVTGLTPFLPGLTRWYVCHVLSNTVMHHGSQSPLQMVVHPFVTNCKLCRGFIHQYDLIAQSPTPDSYQILPSMHVENTA